MTEKKSLVKAGLSLWNNEDGAIISAELVLVMTIAVLAMLVGLKDLSLAVNSELEDVAEAIGAISQSYTYAGLSAPGKAIVSGSSFNDKPDTCDCTPLDTEVGHINVRQKCE